MPRCAIYARFSTDRQSPNSAEDQVRICREHAAREGWEISEVYADLAISGASNRRPGMTAMLQDAAAGSFDILLAEGLDRIARNQADIATIYQRLEFAKVAIVTLSEGRVNELHIGLKGTMGALFLKDLGDKIRRGQRGSIARGRIPGGLCYGYEAAPELRADGTLDRGIRRINPEQAEVVRRIYREYRDGRSPKKIAHGLNADGIPSARGGEWRASALIGAKGRLIGVLRNPIYVGRFVYNRVKMVRDPDSRNRVSRANDADARLEGSFPELRIVDDELWTAVQQARSERGELTLAYRKRPKHFLSGLVQCAACGGNVVVIGGNRWGCSRHCQAGTCPNARRIAGEELNSRVLAGLQRQLLSPEAVALLVREYHAERKRQSRRTAQDQALAERRIATLETAIARLVNSIADGGDVPEIRQAIADRREERSRLKAQIAEREASSVIALHPQIAEVYRAKIRTMATALAQGGADGAIALQVRELIDSILIGPAPDGSVQIEVRGSMAAVLAIANGQRHTGGGIHRRATPVVAEEGLEPPTPGL